MLRITIPAEEYYDDEAEVFVMTKACTLDLEHSLISVSKWESKFQKAFLSPRTKSDEEMLEYIRCMTIQKNVNREVYDRLTTAHVSQIAEYIGSPETATRFPDGDTASQTQQKTETTTAELIYYWMFSMNIPYEFERWHLNRLLTLIRIFALKNSPQKKVSLNEVLSRNRRLNAERQAKYNTKG